MDTGSHLLFGATLTGLAFLDPGLSGNPLLAHALLVSALIGSHAPDFDTVVRLKSYNHYIRFHRGITHSLPAWFLWPAVISLPVAYLFGVMESVGLLYFWTMISVMLHVGLDWLNAYGVQCLRPFDRRWLHLDILPLFDPLLFTGHASALVMWLWGGWPPQILFPVVYAGSLLYILFRIAYHNRLILRIKAKYRHSKSNVQLVPGLMWFNGQFIVETEGEYFTGSVIRGAAETRNTYQKERSHPAALATMEADGVKAFLHFAERVHVNITEKQDGFLVQWRDVRFWHNNKLPFGVDVRLDHDFQVLREHLHWNKKAWDPPYV
jgi:inner membrane protein